MKKNGKQLIFAGLIIGLCLGTALSPFMDIAAFDCLPDQDWKVNQSNDEIISFFIIDDLIWIQNNVENEFIQYHAFTTAFFLSVLIKI